ncbi:unannotated protein [freshwater metagenome]|uniref:Unannotated protein n=1 Tax=freshwater metagenome TaxID=449393 RepID=A0A6J6Y7Y7_9ZZZZ
MAPRSPFTIGSLVLIAVAAMRAKSNEPMRLMLMTRRYQFMSNADSYLPSLPMVRCA